MKFSARFILTPLLFSIFLLTLSVVEGLFTIPSVFAQAKNPPPNFTNISNQFNPYTVPNTTPDVPKNLHTWTQNVMIEVMSAMSCQLSGIDPTNPKHQCLGVDSKSGKIGYVQGGGGAIGIMGKMIGMLYTPPLHTGDYFKYLASNFGIAKPAYASGFEGLKPIQSVWVAFRNIVYLLFVVIFVVIGLAIMLRVRIDPRTVMTIQNQIPKIIIGILLVTFSFAIAGFLIDLMYVVIFLGYEIIASTNITDVTKLNPLQLAGQTALGAAGGIKGGGVFGIAHNIAYASREIITDFLHLSLIPLSGFKTIFDIYKAIFTSGSVTDAITNGLANYLVDFASIGVALRIGSTMTTLVSNPTFLGITIPIGTSAGITFGLIAFAVMEELLRFAIPYLIVFLVVLIALAFALFRLWFTLIIAYVSILLDVVLAPFWIAGALLPGSPIGFTAWLRSIISNLAAFPTTIIMFLLAKVFIDAFGASKASTDFVPPLIGVVPGTAPGTDIIGNFIGLGILLMTPSVVAMVKAALKAPGVPAGGPIMAAIAVGGGVMTGPAGALKQGIGLAFGQAAAARFGLGGTPKKVAPAPSGSTPCLPGNSLISVPNGFALIKNLKSGDLIWSVDRLGRRVHTVIVKKTKRIVSKYHKMAHIVLKDGRKLIVSLGHPTIDYRQLGSLVKGDRLDTSFVSSIKVLSYKGKYTYDILPDGDTGGYWADNILIGSTLSSQFQETISDGFPYFKSIE